MSTRSKTILQRAFPSRSRAARIARFFSLFLALSGAAVLLAEPGAFWESSPRTAALDAGISQTAAQTLMGKIALLFNPSLEPHAWLRPVAITETEANSYLKFHGREFLPPAVYNPEIHIAADHVSAAADVDFDELEKVRAQSDDWGTKILALVFKGKQRVTAIGKLQTGNGQGRMSLESLDVGSTRIPAGFANFLLQSYVEKRYKVDLSKPFALPIHVTHIVLGDGVATLYRGLEKNR